MPIRIEFDATLDDMADASIRFIRQSATLRRARANEIALVGLVSGAGLVVALLVRADRLTTSLISIAGLAATALGLFSAMVYRLVYDSTVRRRIRRVASEQLAGARSVHCEIELRPEALWIRQGGTDIAFQWSEALAVHDTDDGIELRFKGGLVVARNRAFPTDAARQAFVREARDLART